MDGELRRECHEVSSEQRRATPFRKQHADGSLWAKGQTVDGQPSGYWEWYRKDGTRLRSGHFEAGRQAGEWRTYDRQGEVYKVTTLKPGAARRPAVARGIAKRPEPKWKSVPAKTPAQYIAALPPDRKGAVKRLREQIRNNLPRGFEETIDYGMIGYVVPHSVYPAGYHADPQRGVPFIALASQKQYVSLYHMGLYDGPLQEWFKAEWPKHTSARLDLGKCCLRFRNVDEIPYDLIGKLARRMTPRAWIEVYEASRAGRSDG
jgi:uncharacterized protein YdhG (YjbR/CyaY superfamily)